jgi:transposase
MINPVPDYKSLYEQELKEKQKALDLLTEKESLLDLRQEQISSLSFQLDKLRKLLFGSKSEKLPLKNFDAQQIELFDLGTTQAQKEELSEEAVKRAEKKPAKKREKGQGRMSLPENLRREIIIIEPAEDTTGCTKIGEEITEVLELIPAEFYVKRYVRPKYARLNGEGVMIGQLPERVIEKGIASESVIAQMSVDKYVYGMPLHRQIDKSRRLGVNIPASTASDWLMKGWRHLIPLWKLLRLMVLEQKYLQADETPLKVLDRDHKNKIIQGYLWVYHGPADKLVLFDYQKGRSANGPRIMLDDFSGIIQTDGYTVYASLFADHPDIMLVYCMAHARRKFVEALKYDKEKATYVLEKMHKLYAIEGRMRDNENTWEERTKIRQEEALPILEDLKKWMLVQLPQVLPKSPLGIALAYAYKRWDGLSAYAMHGQIEIDNNLAENAIRPIAIGRKNYLFAGSHQAAEMTAAMYSFMSTCKRNNVDEFAWLKDVLERVQSIKHKDLYQLLPNNWEKYKSK